MSAADSNPTTKWIPAHCKEAEDSLRSLRYIAMAACTWLLYDHIITIRREVDLVWKAPSSIAKWGFLIHRYLSPVTVTFILYGTAGIATGGRLSEKNSCRQSVPAAGVLTVAYNVFGDIIAVLHVSALWRHRATVLRTLIGLYIVSTISSIVFTGYAISLLFPSIQYNPDSNSCIAKRVPSLMAIPWIPSLLYDIVMLIFTVWDAFERPRDAESSALSGIGYFMGTIVIRLFIIAVTLSAPPWIFDHLMTFAWPCFSLNLAHFVFRLRRKGNVKEGRDDADFPLKPTSYRDSANATN